MNIFINKAQPNLEILTSTNSTESLPQTYLQGNPTEQITGRRINPDEQQRIINSILSKPAPDNNTDVSSKSIFE
jgi:hypothetical protein